LTICADTHLAQHYVPSANFGPRRGGVSPNLLLLHYTGMPSVGKAIAWLAAPESEVSCHYVAGEDGAITQMVAEDMRAWHAGVSHWAGCDDINSCSIGIEIHNPGPEYGYPDFPDIQMQALERLCRDIIERHAIPAARVLGHSDVAPGRKRDPGEKFDWARLAGAGIGLWTQPWPVEGDEGLSLGDAGPGVSSLQELLRAYGYGIEVSGVYCQHTVCTVYAFQRHFRTACINGRADRSTIKTLDALLAARM
jgi:N-acetylmuramoyl-L-alanine amidase